jgi:hypothetical protein
MKVAEQQSKRHLVTVTLGITTEDGQSQTLEKQLSAGPTKVPVLKEELGVPEDSSLWVVGKSGKKRVLGDHETYDVKEDDHFEALVKGGVS